LRELGKIEIVAEHLVSQADVALLEKILPLVTEQAQLMAFLISDPIAQRRSGLERKACADPQAGKTATGFLLGLLWPALLVGLGEDPAPAMPSGVIPGEQVLWDKFFKTLA